MPPQNFEGNERQRAVPPVENLKSSLEKLEGDASPELIDSMTDTIMQELKVDYEVELSESQIINLKIKLARSLQRKDSKEEDHKVKSAERIAKLELDLPNIADALAETPRFLESSKGSIAKLLDIHSVKTLQKIAERRRTIALKQGDEGYNPYENLFETSDGKYYLARLLNKMHLEQESDYLKHCIGEDDKPYLRRVVSGETEVFSFRDKTTGNPVWTIEYSRKANVITGLEGLRTKELGSMYPSIRDESFDSLMEALEVLQGTQDDTGKRREIKNKFIGDMKRLKVICKKIEKEATAPLTADDLRFLYAIDRNIDTLDRSAVGMALSQRDIKNDMKIIYGPETVIATEVSEITSKTKVAYLYINDEYRLFLKDRKEDGHALRDTARLTTIQKKMEGGKELSAIDLKFLYEIKRPMKQLRFYYEDPRLEELKAKRNAEDDGRVMFGGDVTFADKVDQINESTSLFCMRTHEGKKTLIKKSNKKYKNRFEETVRINTVKQKTKEGVPLTSDEIRWLYTGHNYHGNGSIEGIEEIDNAAVKQPVSFYQYNSGDIIKEVRKTRNRLEDAKNMWGCPPSSVAANSKEVTLDTLVYCEHYVNGPRNNFHAYDYRIESDYKQKIESVYQLCQKIKEVGSTLEVDLYLEGGIVSVDISLDEVKDLKTALESRKFATRIGSPYSYQPVPEFTPPLHSHLEIIPLRYRSEGKEGGELFSVTKVLEDIDEIGLRPCTFEELVCLGIAKRKIVQKAIQAIALGTKGEFDGDTCFYQIAQVWNGEWDDTILQAVPTTHLEMVDKKNKESWKSYYRFICVKK